MMLFIVLTLCAITIILLAKDSKPGRRRKISGISLYVLSFAMIHLSSFLNLHFLGELHDFYKPVNILTAFSLLSRLSPVFVIP